MEIKNAVIESVTLEKGDRGLLQCWLHLSYGGSGQGFGGYALYLPKSFAHHSMQSVAGHFMFRCMEVAGVDNWADMAGRTIRVRADNGKVYAIGHIVKDDWFDPAEDFSARSDADEESEALRDMLDSARADMEMLREALGVPAEPHQSLIERMVEAAQAKRGAVPEGWREDVYLAAQMLTWADDDGGLTDQQDRAIRAHQKKMFAMLAAAPAPDQLRDAAKMMADPAGDRIAAAIHYPECWDTAVYPTIESALSEVFAHYRCTEHAAPAGVPMPKPVAYGFGNTAITGHTNRLMMVRIDIPGGDQYAGAFWLPLVLADEAHTYGVACRAAGEAAGYARGLRDAVRDADIEALRLYVRALCKAVDAATDFAGTVAGGASWWDDVWADHAAALDRARERISQAALRGEVKP